MIFNNVNVLCPICEKEEQSVWFMSFFNVSMLDLFGLNVILVFAVILGTLNLIFNLSSPISPDDK